MCSAGSTHPCLDVNFLCLDVFFFQVRIRQMGDKFYGLTPNLRYLIKEETSSMDIESQREDDMQPEQHLSAPEGHSDSIDANDIEACYTKHLSSYEEGTDPMMVINSFGTYFDRLSPEEKNNYPAIVDALKSRKSLSLPRIKRSINPLDVYEIEEKEKQTEIPKQVDRMMLLLGTKQSGKSTVARYLCEPGQSRGEIRPTEQVQILPWEKEGKIYVIDSPGRGGSDEEIQTQISTSIIIQNLLQVASSFVLVFVINKGNFLSKRDAKETLEILGGYLKFGSSLKELGFYVLTGFTNNQELQNFKNILGEVVGELREKGGSTYNIGKDLNEKIKYSNKIDENIAQYVIVFNEENEIMEQTFSAKLENSFKRQPGVSVLMRRKCKASIQSQVQILSFRFRKGISSLLFELAERQFRRLKVLSRLLQYYFQNQRAGSGEEAKGRSHSSQIHLLGEEKTYAVSLFAERQNMLMNLFRRTLGEQRSAEELSNQYHCLKILDQFLSHLGIEHNFHIRDLDRLQKEEQRLYLESLAKDPTPQRYSFGLSYASLFNNREDTFADTIYKTLTDERDRLETELIGALDQEAFLQLDQKNIKYKYLREVTRSEGADPVQEKLQMKLYSMRELLGEESIVERYLCLDQVETHEIGATLRNICKVMQGSFINKEIEEEIVPRLNQILRNFTSAAKTALQDIFSQEEVRNQGKFKQAIQNFLYLKSLPSSHFQTLANQLNTKIVSIRENLKNKYLSRSQTIDFEHLCRVSDYTKIWMEAEEEYQIRDSQWKTINEDIMELITEKCNSVQKIWETQKRRMQANEIPNHNVRRILTDVKNLKETVLFTRSLTGVLETLNKLQKNILNDVAAKILGQDLRDSDRFKNSSGHLQKIARRLSNIQRGCEMFGDSAIWEKLVDHELEVKEWLKGKVQEFSNLTRVQVQSWKQKKEITQAEAREIQKMVKVLVNLQRNERISVAISEKLIDEFEQVQNSLRSVQDFFCDLSGDLIESGHADQAQLMLNKLRKLSIFDDLVPEFRNQKRIESQNGAMRDANLSWENKIESLVNIRTGIHWEKVIEVLQQKNDQQKLQKIKDRMILYFDQKHQEIERGLQNSPNDRRLQTILNSFAGLHKDLLQFNQIYNEDSWSQTFQVVKSEVDDIIRSRFITPIREKIIARKFEEAKDKVMIYKSYEDILMETGLFQSTFKICEQALSEIEESTRVRKEYLTFLSEFQFDLTHLGRKSLSQFNADLESLQKIHRSKINDHDIQSRLEEIKTKCEAEIQQMRRNKDNLGVMQNYEQFSEQCKVILRIYHKTVNSNLQFFSPIVRNVRGIIDQIIRDVDQAMNLQTEEQRRIKESADIYFRKSKSIREHLNNQKIALLEEQERKRQKGLTRINKKKQQEIRIQEQDTNGTEEALQLISDKFATQQVAAGRAYQEACAQIEESISAQMKNKIAEAQTEMRKELEGFVRVCLDLQLCFEIFNSVLQMQEQTFRRRMELFISENRNRTKLLKIIIEEVEKSQMAARAQLFREKNPNFRAESRDQFLRRTQHVTIEEVLAKMNLPQEDNKALIESYHICSSQMKKWIQLYTQNPEEQVKKNLAEQIRAKGNEIDIKQKNHSNLERGQAAELLGRIFGLMTILKSSSEDEGCTVTYDFQPHPVQIVAIFLLLNIQDPRSGNAGRNALAEIKTGEGKSVVLAGLSIYKAVCGFSVFCACYSSYLSVRDFEEFSQMFQFLKIEGKIRYGTFEELAKQNLHDFTEGVREVVTTEPQRGFLNRIIDNIATRFSNQSAEAKNVLLIDEVDVLFQSNYFGEIYKSAIPLKGQEVTAFIKAAYQKKKGIAQLPEMNSLLLRYSALRQYLKGSFVQELEYLSQNFQYHEERRKYEIIDGTIQYKSCGGYDPNISEGLKTSLAFVEEARRRPELAESLQSKIEIPLTLAEFSYAELPNFYNQILGVTGSLVQMSKQKEEYLKNNYRITRKYYLPSAYGENSLRKLNQRMKVSEQRLSETLIREIEEKLLQGRAVLVFFENASEIWKLFNSQEYRHLQKSTKCLDESFTLQEKQKIVQRAGNKGMVTLITGDLGRGTDFRVSEEVATNGGHHVIQTYLSETLSQEIQVQGRTARQSNKGSYLSLVSEAALEKFNIQKGTNFWTEQDDNALRNAREAMEESADVAMIERAEQIGKNHQQTLDFISSRPKRKEVIARVISLSEFKKPIADRTIRLVIGIDGTMSMNKPIENLRKVLINSLRELETFLADVRACIEINIVVYRNYNCIPQKLALQQSGFKTSAEDLCRFLRNEVKVKGGIVNQALELLYHNVNQSEGVKSLIIIGDAIANTAEETKEKRARFNWNLEPPVRAGEQLAQLKKKVSVYSFYILKSDATRNRGVERYFQGISNKAERYEVDSSDASRRMTEFLQEWIIEQTARSREEAERGMREIRRIHMS